jgi:hypothetical protein
MDTPQGIELASEQVDIEGVDHNLMAFLSHLGLVHALLFGKPLVITSGVDAIHSAGSLHKVGRAADLRTADKDNSGNELLLHLLAYAASGNPIAVFDERRCAGGSHIHVEWHG